MATYNSVAEKLNSFTLDGAANRGAAIEKLETFLDECRGDFKEVMRGGVTDEQKNELEKKQKALFAQINAKFPAAEGGGRKGRKNGRKTRAAKLRRRKQKKTRSAYRKVTRKNY
jgi:hypothetical protein